MSLISEELYYSANHEWVHVDENIATIGLTNFKQNDLGELLYIDLPDEGKNLHQGEVAFAVESTKHIHDLIAPVSGIVLEINQELVDNPGLINDDPIGAGWILRIEMEKESDLAILMRSASYKNFLQNLKCESDGPKMDQQNV